MGAWQLGVFGVHEMEDWVHVDGCSLEAEAEELAVY